MPDQRWKVVIELSGSATGHRTLTADNCSQLARASSLIIALAANPDAALDLPGDESAVASTPEQQDVGAKVPLNSGKSPDHRNYDHGRNTPPSAPASPRRELDVSGQTPQSTVGPTPLELLSRVGYEMGSLPTSTAWLGLGVRQRTFGDSASFVLTTYVTQGTSAAFTTGIGASFRAFGAQARACIESGGHHFHLSGCAGVQLALVRASAFVHGDDLVTYGYGNAVTYTIYRWIPSALLGLNPRYEFTPRFTAELGVDLAIPTTHWQFVIENMAPLFRPAQMQYQLYLGIAYQLK